VYISVGSVDKCTQVVRHAGSDRGKHRKEPRGNRAAAGPWNRGPSSEPIRAAIGAC
jgi:hypothetical protein